MSKSCADRERKSLGTTEEGIRSWWRLCKHWMPSCSERSLRSEKVKASGDVPVRGCQFMLKANDLLRCQGGSQGLISRIEGPVDAE